MQDSQGQGEMEFAFTGIASFLRSPVCQDLSKLDADIAIIGAPTDEGSPFLPGSRFGPRSIREHSMRFVTDPPGIYDPQRRVRMLEREMARGRIVDCGDAAILPTNVAGSFRSITDRVSGVLRKDALPVIVGGDHAVTFPAVRAFEDHGPLHVVHFDAHLDYMPFIHGLEYTNQHAFRHIRRMANVRTLTQVGIRSLRGSQVMLEDSLRDGNRVVTMDEFRREPAESLIAGIPAGSRCYVSIDIDVLDLSLVPGCVSAEPDGMSYAELRDGLRVLAHHTRIAGFDLVEVNPVVDLRTGVTSYLAAHLIIEFLGMICDQPGWKAP